MNSLLIGLRQKIPIHRKLVLRAKKTLIAHNTSQNCSNCGQKVKKSLSTRTHICHHSGLVEDRDINASINILKLGLTRVGHIRSYATGDLPSWVIGVNLSSNGESVNVESPSL
jgi:putative transposase